MIEKLGKVLKKARLDLGLTQFQVANQLGTSHPYYNGIENDKLAPPLMPTLQRLANVLKLDINKLQEIAELTRIDFKKEKLEQQRKSLGFREPTQKYGIHRIPILSEIPAGHPKEYTDQDYPPGIAEDYYEFKVDDPNAFFLRAEGDCMSPEIKNGDLLLIYPNEKVENHDIVVITNGRGEKEIRRINIQPDQIILSADNSAYPVKVWGAKDKPKIIGRVKEIIRRR